MDKKLGEERLLRGDCVLFDLENGTMGICRPNESIRFIRHGDDKLAIRIALDKNVAMAIASGIAFSHGLFGIATVCDDYCPHLPRMVAFRLS
jgi:hypothetical protein